MKKRNNIEDSFVDKLITMTRIKMAEEKKLWKKCISSFSVCQSLAERNDKYCTKMLFDNHRHDFIVFHQSFSFICRWITRKELEGVSRNLQLCLLVFHLWLQGETETRLVKEKLSLLNTPTTILLLLPTIHIHSFLLKTFLSLWVEKKIRHCTPALSMYRMEGGWVGRRGAYLVCIIESTCLNACESRRGRQLGWVVDVSTRARY